MIPVFERTKTVQALDRAATVTGISLEISTHKSGAVMLGRTHFEPFTANLED
jgi:hypothetical protein